MNLWSMRALPCGWRGWFYALGIGPGIVTVYPPVRIMESQLLACGVPVLLWAAGIPRRRTGNISVHRDILGSNGTASHSFHNLRP